MVCIFGSVENTLVVENDGVFAGAQINHPLDCPICDQGGECDLQDQVRPQFDEGVTRNVSSSERVKRNRPSSVGVKRNLSFHEGVKRKLR